MRWFWQRDLEARLDHARTEHTEVRRRRADVEKRARRAERRLEENGFADGFRRALGGQQS